MSDKPRDVESTDTSGLVGRRTMLKGVAAGLVGASAAGTAVTGTAAAGTTDGTASASENHIVLEADERPVEYRIEVSGQIVKAEGAGQTDSIVHDHVAVGTMLRTDEIDDAWDGFRYTGRIVRFDVFQGSFGRVWINGERVHPDDIGHPDPPKVTVLEDFEDRVWPGEWTDLVGEYQLTDAIRVMMDDGKNVMHKSIPGEWIDVGTPERLKQANREFEL